MSSIDLTDAYFHIPVHPVSKPLLRFVHQGKLYNSEPSPLDCRPAQKTFTKIMKPVAAFAHQHSVRLHLYLDDWLLIADIHQIAKQQTEWLLLLCNHLGLVVNHAKSTLIPLQQIIYLGIQIDTKLNLAKPSEKRKLKLTHLISTFLSQAAPTAYEWLQIMGHLTSLEKIVPKGRTRIRPLQWQLKSLWRQNLDPMYKRIPISQECLTCLQWWADNKNLMSGVPLVQTPIDHLLFSDASSKGWGTHMDGLKASGIWNHVQQQQHINILELHAVWLGMKAFRQQICNKTVAIMSDNTTTVAYIKNEGGDKVKGNVRSDTEVTTLARRAQCDNGPKTHSGTHECIGRSIEPKGTSSKNRMELESYNVQQNMPNIGQTNDRSVCHETKHKITNLHIADTRPTSMESRCSYPVNNLDAYAYPPTTLIRPCLNKVKSENVDLILIAPNWPNQEWFTDILDLLVQKPIKLPHSKILLKQTFSHRFRTGCSLGE